MTGFTLTAKQKQALEICSGSASNILLYGGSRSAKTFLICRNIVMRSLIAPGSRHAILRYRFNHVKQTIGLQTMPDVLRLAFPGINPHLDKSDWYWRFSNGSQIWLAGLDDKERTEKILGSEYATLFKNECSQIPWASNQMARTRLAQRVMCKIEGEPDRLLPLRDYNDCNPPRKSHWSYQVFFQKKDPDTKKPLVNFTDYVSMQMNPVDNAENLAPGYIDTLSAQSPYFKRRFFDGEFSDDNPDALFSDTVFDQWRVIDGKVPDMVRIVVAVDPSGAGDVDNADNDEIGIVVVGLGTDGNAYLIEDDTVKAGPETWGRVSTSAYDRNRADVIVGEKNYGGDMVRFVIQAARPATPFKFVTASRGKVQRAAPIASLYSQGKVRHVGFFAKLEEEYTGFSAQGYIGARSPNRADAAIWAITELFPGIVKESMHEVEPGFKSQYSNRLAIA